MQKLLGIDLGTYNSEAAIVTIKDDGSDVIIEILRPKNDSTQIEKIKSFPSFVAYNKDGTVQYVGIEAKRRLPLDPEKVIWGMKRLLGKTYSEATEQNEIDRFLYQIEPDSDTGQCSIIIGQKKLHPEDVCAELLRKIRREAERISGVRFHEVVISVPAYFDAVPVTSIIHAAKKAGFEQIHTIPEPVAAAIIYNIPVTPRPSKVLVFDLGAGTLDVTLGLLRRNGLNIKDITFIIKTTTGNTHLGGIDMDDRMETLILKKLDISDRTELNTDNLNKLRAIAENTKIKLSKEKIVEISGFMGYRKFHITEEEFRRALKGCANETDILEECDQQVYLALDNAGWSVREIDLLFLIGGPSSLPIIQDRLSQIFRDNPNVTEQMNHYRQGLEKVDLMTAVAQGAALSQETSRILVHPYGYGFVDMDFLPNEIISKPVILIPRGASYPTKKVSKRIGYCVCNEIITKIQIIQQLPPGVDTNEFRSLGEVEIASQTPKSPIEIGMELNENEELCITLTDQLYGLKVEYAGIGRLRRTKIILPVHMPRDDRDDEVNIDKSEDIHINEDYLPEIYNWSKAVCLACSREKENKKISDSKLDSYHSVLMNTLKYELKKKENSSNERLKTNWIPLMHHTLEVIHRAHEMNVFDQQTAGEFERSRNNILSRIKGHRR